MVVSQALEGLWRGADRGLFLASCIDQLFDGSQTDWQVLGGADSCSSLRSFVNSFIFRYSYMGWAPREGHGSCGGETRELVQGDGGISSQGKARGGAKALRERPKRGLVVYKKPKGVLGALVVGKRRVSRQPQAHQFSLIDCMVVWVAEISWGDRSGG